MAQYVDLVADADRVARYRERLEDLSGTAPRPRSASPSLAQTRLLGAVNEYRQGRRSGDTPTSAAATVSARGEADLAATRPRADGPYEEQLLDLEVQFNRQMEITRRKDLDAKLVHRQRQTEEHIRMFEDFHRLSNMKSVALVELFQEREAQLRNEFHRVLELERLKYETILAEKDRQLVAARAGYRIETPRVISSSAAAPFFGLEISDDGLAEGNGVRVVSASGPSAQAGIQPNDIVHQITLPVPIRSKADFLHAIGKVDAGEKTHFAVIRNGKLEKMMVTPLPKSFPSVPAAVIQS